MPHLEFTDPRISALLSGRRAVRRVPFPGIDGSEIGIRILTAEEMIAARGEATQAVQSQADAIRIDLGKQLVIDPELFDLEVQFAIVQRAVFEAETDKDGKHKPFFPSQSAVRAFPTDVVYRLYEAYRGLEEMADPKPMTPEERDRIVDALKKTPDPEALSLAYPPNTVRRLLLFLARQWWD